MNKIISVLLAIMLLVGCCSLPIGAAVADSRVVSTGASAINAFLNSATNTEHYNVYDGSNENNYFMMTGRKYTHGFTLASNDGYYKPEVTFNVENIDSIEMTIGHLDDRWCGDATMKVYRDGEWWQDVELTVHGALMTKTFKVTSNSLLRFKFEGRAMYGFADIKIDGESSAAPEIPEYMNVNAFMESGYDLEHYNVYDDSNDNSNFMMTGRKYTHGFTLASDDGYYKPEVTFNVENINSIEMTIGHLDDRWCGDATLKVYRDGEWWQDIELTVHGTLTKKTFNVSDNSTLRFKFEGRAMYGFAEIKIDEKTSTEPEIPEYKDVNAFMESGYDIEHYKVYDDSNENNFFKMAGREYTQGFTLASNDGYYKPEVSFNVENLKRIRFAVGHLDDQGGSDQELIIYKDGNEYYRIPLKVDGGVNYYTLSLLNTSTLRFYISPHCDYGFTDITFDDAVAPGKSESDYTDIDQEMGEDPGEDHLRGDYDGDGEITIMDATRVQNILAEKIDMPDAEFLAAVDADGDGELTIMDATRIQNYLAEKLNMDGTPYEES